MARTALTPGTDNGHFHIHSLLGKGAMAEVYLATDRRNDREVALKVLTCGFGTAEARLQRFEREAHAIGVLNHPNVVSIYEVGKLGRTPYIAMEHVDGPTLRELLDEGPLEPERACELAAQIAAGLSAAHRCGIVHRDLKPDNVMLASDGTVKILDFGLSKPLTRGGDDDPDELTLPGTILGTLEYMSPEQAAGKPVDYRGDQFAFGTILYEMLSGRGAFYGESVMRVLQAVMNANAAPLSEDVPDALRQFVSRCLNKNPDDRFASMDEAIEALNAARLNASGGRKTMLALCGIVLVILGAAFLI